MRAPSPIYRLLFLLMIMVMLGAATWYGAVAPQGLTVKQHLLTLQQLPSVLRKEISTPPPLRGPREAQRSALTIAGILHATNEHREAGGLQPVRGSAILGQAAQRKVDDMFAQQYFDHVSPDGVKPADLVDGVGYRYLRVGENLALGNFADDATLVQAWMDSPGHRENIMSPRFTELGIAVGQGTFEGQQTWLAVQTFALPLSACPQPDDDLQQEFQERKAAAEALGITLEAQYTEITQQAAALIAQREQIEELLADAREKIQAGNTEIARGNEIYEETGSEEQARPYWQRGEDLQTEGQALQAQAESLRGQYNAQAEQLTQQQTEYNSRVQLLRQQEEELKELSRTINQQVSVFNACLAE